MGSNMLNVGAKKCDKCDGKGGWHIISRRFGIIIDTFQDCIQCRGKGKWWPNNKPKRGR